MPFKSRALFSIILCLIEAETNPLMKESLNTNFYIAQLGLPQICNPETAVSVPWDIQQLIHLLAASSLKEGAQQKFFFRFHIQFHQEYYRYFECGALSFSSHSTGYPRCVSVPARPNSDASVSTINGMMSLLKQASSMLHCFIFSSLSLFQLLNM